VSKARSLLDRVRELESGGKNPILRKIGSVERLERALSQPLAAEVDPHVGPFLLECVRSWIDGTDIEHNGQPFPEEFRV
jgi:hypothetical protein